MDLWDCRFAIADLQLMSCVKGVSLMPFRKNRVNLRGERWHINLPQATISFSNLKAGWACCVFWRSRVRAQTQFGICSRMKNFFQVWRLPKRRLKNPAHFTYAMRTWL